MYSIWRFFSIYVDFQDGTYSHSLCVCVCVGDERGAEDQQSHGDQLHARGLQVTAAPSLKQNNRTVHLYAFTSENAL